MKKLISAVILSMLLTAGVVSASPYIVTDSFTASMVDNCIVNIDGMDVVVAPVPTTGDQARCVYDVGSVASGNHQMTMHTENMWGVSDPVPFDFTKSLPPNLSGIRLEE